VLSKENNVFGNACQEDSTNKSHCIEYRSWWWRPNVNTIYI